MKVLFAVVKGSMPDSVSGVSSNVAKDAIEKEDGVEDIISGDMVIRGDSGTVKFGN